MGQFEARAPAGAQGRARLTLRPSSSMFCSCFFPARSMVTALLCTRLRFWLYFMALLQMSSKSSTKPLQVRYSRARSCRACTLSSGNQSSRPGAHAKCVPAAPCLLPNLLLAAAHMDRQNTTESAWSASCNEVYQHAALHDRGVL